MDRRLSRNETLERFATAAFSTERPDRERAEAAIAILYRGAGLKAPQVIWRSSPRAACLAADETVATIACDTFPGDRLKPQRHPRRRRDEITHILLPWLRPHPGSWIQQGADIGGVTTAYPEALWRAIGFGHGLKIHPAHITTFSHGADASTDEQRSLLGLVENVGWWRFHRTAAILSERPKSIILDHLDRPHSTEGPAVTFRDGWSVYAVDGIRVPAWAVEHPERLKASDIDEVVNTELRRILATLAGDRYIESRGSLEHADGWGELWSVPLISGRFLKVTDATPRPDGTSRTYWLRVPGTVTKAHEAVAWTFGLEPDVYNPIKET